MTGTQRRSGADRPEGREGPPSAGSIAERRLASNRLVGPALGAPVEVVRWFGAMQAQEYGPATWAIGLRTRGVTGLDVDRLFDAGAILRTHVLRPTWHFVVPEDLRWLLALTGPRVHVANGPLYRQMDLDAGILHRAHATIRSALEGGATHTRQELAAALRTAGVEAEGPRLAYIVMHAELEALICSGPRRGRQFTYALLDERVPPAPPRDRDDALAEIARRYVTSRGPAQAVDLAWWSGLTVTDSRRALELAGDDLEVFELGRRRFWAARAADALDPVAFERPLVRLLPIYDEYFIGFRDRSDFGDAARLGRDDDALGANIVVLDGSIVGGWRRTTGKGQVAIAVELLVRFDAAERRALETAAAEFGRFVGLPVALTVTERPAAAIRRSALP
ncbi:MAG TPA: winged helix DNA-binding domain-containing protein [Candidatus Limnocylindrales bacterium]|nr:winged helix DNA-binding domain-containing protein [Candidatus Limnocylindrales bacterium]